MFIDFIDLFYFKRILKKEAPYLLNDCGNNIEPIYWIEKRSRVERIIDGNEFHIILEKQKCPREYNHLWNDIEYDIE